MSHHQQHQKRRSQEQWARAGQAGWAGWQAWQEAARTGSAVTPADRLRIGDADREQAAAALGEHYAQGRITTDEHGERLDRIWSARTRAELAPVFADLPAPGPVTPAPAPPTPPWARRSLAGPSGTRRRLPLFPLLLIALVVGLVTELPVFPLLLVGGLVWLTFRRGGCWGPSRR